MSGPDVDHAREAVAALGHMVVQDIFLTETAYLADVVLPATAWPEKVGTVTNTDRMVQLGRKAIEPPGGGEGGPWLLKERAQREGPSLKSTSRRGGATPGRATSPAGAAAEPEAPLSSAGG